VKIIHRVSFGPTPQDREDLARMGIVVGNALVEMFKVDESQEVWPAVREWIARRKPTEIVYTKFSKSEVDAAPWLHLMADWHHGYPQPEDEFAYLGATYDLTNFCRECGIGKKQKAPFQMTGEPKWGSKSIMQLNWVFDEYFVTPQVWKQVFEPAGIRCMPVTNTKGAELKTVVQLVVDERVDIDTTGLSFEKCPHCHRIKYEHAGVARGMFPAMVHQPSGLMVKTNQYFGSGASAEPCVLLAQPIAHAMRVAEVRGGALQPIRDVRH